MKPELTVKYSAHPSMSPQLTSASYRGGTFSADTLAAFGEDNGIRRWTNGICLTEHGAVGYCVVTRIDEFAAFMHESLAFEGAKKPICLERPFVLGPVRLELSAQTQF